MRLFGKLKARKDRKRERREELRRRGRLIDEFAHQHDAHGFPVRTHWPD